jgi:hypothetical protein
MTRQGRLYGLSTVSIAYKITLFWVTLLQPARLPAVLVWAIHLALEFRPHWT